MGGWGDKKITKPFFADQINQIVNLIKKKTFYLLQLKSGLSRVFFCPLSISAHGQLAGWTVGDAPVGGALGRRKFGFFALRDLDI
jgi:hypothetical protein